MPEKIVVIGIGYVGLPLAIMLARSGYEVVGVDVNEEIVNDVNAGNLRFAENEIRAVFQEPQVQSNLKASSVPCKADAFIISVPTPIDERKKIADLSYVIKATESIVPFLNTNNLVIVESTIPPLTCREVVLPLLEKSGYKVGTDIFLAHCPERILPGNVFFEITQNDRIIGGIDEKSSIMAHNIYSSFVKGNIFLSNDKTAELVKLMENTYRDVNIALANEFAAVCEKIDVNVMECIRFANKHPRVRILNPGIGTGGHCIPVDPWFIHQIDPFNSRLIYVSRMTNEEIPLKIASKIRRALKNIANPKIIALGVTYKPNTYDKRNSPAIQIIEMLEQDGYDITAYDPFADGYTFGSIKSLVNGADCLAVLVEHDIIRNEMERDRTEIEQSMKHPIIMRFFTENTSNDSQRIRDENSLPRTGT